jgi:hypothetical protein
LKKKTQFDKLFNIKQTVIEKWGTKFKEVTIEVKPWNFEGSDMKIEDEKEKKRKSH